MQDILRWPLREVLLRYVYLIQEEAKDVYRTNLLIWAARSAMGGGKPPKMPKILERR